MCDRDPKLDGSQYHLVLLAKNEEGYNISDKVSFHGLHGGLLL
jgi:hypothetical protein